MINKRITGSSFEDVLGARGCSGCSKPWQERCTRQDKLQQHKSQCNRSDPLPITRRRGCFLVRLPLAFHVLWLATQTQAHQFSRIFSPRLATVTLAAVHLVPPPALGLDTLSNLGRGQPGQDMMINFCCSET